MRPSLFEADVHAARVGQHHQLAHALAQQHLDVHALARIAALRRVLARQVQQLLDQVLCARDAGLELVEALGGFAGRHVRAQVLDLQADGGHGRAQLVRRVLHEAALRGEGAAHARQQVVEGAHHHAPAQPAHVADGVGAQLAPHAVDQDVDRIAAHFFAPAVDAVFQLLAREDGAGPLQQRVQQRELARESCERSPCTSTSRVVRSSCTACGADHRMRAPSRRRITARMRASSSRIS
jgi:hypothetical protein